MFPEEEAIMGQHMAYTRLLFDRGKIVLGGCRDGRGYRYHCMEGGFGRGDAADL